MNNEELEEQMRQAITSDPMMPAAELWTRIATTTQPQPVRRVQRWITATAALAAGIAGLVIVLRQQPAAEPVRTVVEEEDQGSSFLAPGALMAQDKPVFPMVRGEGPRGLRLRGGRWKYVYIRNDTDTLPSVFTYSIRRDSVNGTAAWALVSSNTHPKAWRHLDSLWVTADSLRPLLRVTTPGGTRLEQTFRRDEILSGYYSPSGYINWKTTPLTDSTRFNEASLVRWADMQTFFLTTTIDSGWKRSIPLSAAAEWSAIRPVWLNFAVDGEEPLVTPAGTFDCWRIRLGMRADPPPGVLLNHKGPVEDSDPGIIFWISKDKGWLVQQAYRGNRVESSSRQVLVEGGEE